MNFLKKEKYTLFEYIITAILFLGAPNFLAYVPHIFPGSSRLFITIFVIFLFVIANHISKLRKKIIIENNELLEVKNIFRKYNPFINNINLLCICYIISSFYLIIGFNMFFDGASLFLLGILIIPFSSIIFFSVYFLRYISSINKINRVISELKVSLSKEGE